MLRAVIPALFCLLSNPLAVFSQSDEIIKQKEELREIKKQLEECRQNLDSLIELEKKSLKEISDYEQKASANETALRRLNAQLSDLRDKIKASKIRSEKSQAELDETQARFEKNLKYYYMGLRWDFAADAGEVRREKDALRRILYLRAMAAYDKRKLTRAGEYLKAAEQDYSALVDKEKVVGAAHRKKKSDYILASTQKEKREKELSRLRRKKESEAERLAALSEAALQMEGLIAQLESDRRKRAEAAPTGLFRYSPENFGAYKGLLPPPASGKIAKNFGWSVDKATRLKSFSPGIEISARPNSAIKAIADGTVAYIGDMRGYGIFIILEHDDGYFSTYAGFAKAAVIKGERVARGETLGTAAEGVVKFELRQGKEPLDPVEWLKIDNIR
jgi:septal ring factor EnvC (AmiA/AmiB activator)